MHTTLSDDNPFEKDRYGFAWAHIPKAGDAHLDFGCNNGQFLETLNKTTNIKLLSGLDIDRKCIQAAQTTYPDFDIHHLKNTIPIPYQDNTFDSITVMEVLEHVYEQEALIDEFYRILKPNGKLIISVPGKHLFSFLDRGNIQFTFPRIFRWYYLRTHSLEEYHYNYVDNPDGLIGCVSAKKMWHEHFTHKKIKRLIGRTKMGSPIFDGSGYFREPIDLIDKLTGRLNIFAKFVEWLKRLDRDLFSSYNVFCVTSKPSKPLDSKLRMHQINDAMAELSNQSNIDQTEKERLLNHSID